MRPDDAAMPNLSPNKDDPALVALGEAIQRARAAAGLSQQEFSERAGIDRSHFGRIERGQNQITVLLLVKIARTLNVTVEELMREAGL